MPSAVRATQRETPPHTPRSSSLSELRGHAPPLPSRESSLYLRGSTRAFWRRFLVRPFLRVHVDDHARRVDRAGFLHGALDQWGLARVAIRKGLVLDWQR